MKIPKLRRKPCLPKAVNNTVTLAELRLNLRKNADAFEADEIICSVLGAERSFLLAHGETVLTDSQISGIEGKIRRLKDGEPLQYIVNKASFWKYGFYIDRGALIPRYDSQVVLEAGLEFLESSGAGKPAVLDMCTGSGILGISILLEYPDADVTCADISSEALRVASLNSIMLKAPVRLIESDLFSEIGEDARYDLIISNPPYISGKEMDELPSPVSCYEPSEALYGGPDGLEFYRKIIPESYKRLAPGGMLALETGYLQGGAVSEIMTSCGFENVHVIKDNGGRDRTVTGIK